LAYARAREEMMVKLSENLPRLPRKQRIKYDTLLVLAYLYAMIMVSAGALLCITVLLLPWGLWFMALAGTVPAWVIENRIKARARFAVVKGIEEARKIIV
jgi:hypothetical protein